MKFVFALFIWVFILITLGCTKEANETQMVDTLYEDVLKACANFSRLNTDLNSGDVLPDEAALKLNLIINPLRQYYKRHLKNNCIDTAWVFPIQGYTAKNIGGSKRDKFGFVDNGCSFFDRGINPGHPAYDIFIRDLNNDGIDDRTMKKANVLAITGGIIIAAEPNWHVGDVGRGGRFIWLYNPAENSFFYCAHNDDVFVKPGDIVVPGQVIATLGRTGANAYKERSQTHMHLCYYHFTNDGRLCPVQFYERLHSARNIPHSAAL